MIVKDVADRLDREKHLLDSARVTSREIQRHSVALYYLLNSWWPEKYIDGKMIGRAADGLVPEYEGEQSWVDYKVRWQENTKRK